jgi:hypothetical protein
MSISLLLLIAAFICFVFSAIGWPAGRINWFNAGFAIAFFALLLLPRF